MNEIPKFRAVLRALQTTVIHSYDIDRQCSSSRGGRVAKLMVRNLDKLNRLANNGTS